MRVIALCLEAYTFEVWDEKLIDERSILDIRNLVQKKMAHRSTSHKKNVFKYTRGAFMYAVDKGLALNNPTPIMKFRIGDKMKQVLNHDQINTLLTQSKNMNCEWYPIWATALYTGMRNGELYALTWDK